MSLPNEAVSMQNQNSKGRLSTQLKANREKKIPPKRYTYISTGSARGEVLSPQTSIV